MWIFWHLLYQVVQSVEKLSVWHNKLAHQNINHIKNFLTSREVRYIDDSENFVCESCLAGKQQRSRFKNSLSRAEKPLELVHADVCGPMETTSLGGARYFLLLKDDFTNYRVVYFLKQKSDVKNYKNVHQTRQTNCKLKILRTDNGLEFCNDSVRELISRMGIRHQTTVAYTPEQNGRAERENRALVEAARSMIKDQNKNLWAEAINTATYVINRTGKISVDNKSPYELWYNKKVNLQEFQVFGAKVSVHIPKAKRRKFDSKNKMGIFIGYNEDVKGYTIYFKEENKIEVQRDVIFIPENKTEVCCVTK